METRAYFDKIQGHIKDELLQARFAIVIAVAWFTDRELFEILLDKAKDGVRVDMLLTDDAINRRSGLDYDSIALGNGSFSFVGERKGRGAVLMHNKFCVIDGHTVITGSYNWSVRASRQYENITIISDAPEFAAQYIAEFEEIKGNSGVTGGGEGRLFARLEALQHIIRTEDEEDIATHVFKLKSLITGKSQYDDIAQTIHYLEQGEWSKGSKQLADSLARRKQVSVYTDPELVELKWEFQNIEVQIETLEREKAEIERVIQRYNYLYAVELGPIMEQILRLREDKLCREAADDPSKAQEYEEAKQDHAEFINDNADAIKLSSKQVNDAELTELKATFRAASRMCHPDMVDDDAKEEASALFRKLNEAYKQNDLTVVHQIHTNLKNGVFSFVALDISDADRLRNLIAELRNKLTELSKAIHQLRSSRVFDVTSKIEDWQGYFVNLKEQLEKELCILKENMP